MKLDLTPKLKGRFKKLPVKIQAKFYKQAELICIVFKKERANSSVGSRNSPLGLR